MRINGRWTTPVNMGQKVNSAAWDSQPTLSADGRLLIFSSRRLGSIGGADLWLTYRNEKDAWVTPVNLGLEINTAGDDESPFLHPDGVTLYFRSNGRPGMGGFDIYYSRKNDINGVWSQPVNIGYPINTEGNEGAFTVSLDGKKAYFASDMNYATGKKNDNLDIFSFDLYEEARPLPTTFIKGYVKDAVTNKPLKASVTIKDLASGAIKFQIITDSSGYFITGIASGRNYACITENKDYQYIAQNFDLSATNTVLKPYVLNIALMPIGKDKKSTEQPVILQNIFFQSGSAELLPESNVELDLLVLMLNRHPEMNITIIGHTDDVGEDSDNQLLSEKRAAAVAKALFIKGITASRISSLGKGESQPIASNDTEAGRKINRRTEFILSQK
jgi:outer membrane protein OmpA-like peptidoglycan-associated protein